MNSIYFRMSTGQCVTRCNMEQDYSDIEAISNAVIQYLIEEEGETAPTVTSYAVANGREVSAYFMPPPMGDCTQNMKDDLKIGPKQDVPGGSTIFPPEGVAVEDIPGDQNVVYVEAPA